MCKLRQMSCKYQTLVEMAYEGICDRCKAKACPHYGTCIDDGIDTSCVCQDSCAEVEIKFYFKLSYRKLN
jgi:hypothetical protein